MPSKPIEMTVKPIEMSVKLIEMHTRTGFTKHFAQISVTNLERKQQKLKQNSFDRPQSHYSGKQRKKYVWNLDLKTALKSNLVKWGFYF